MKIYINSKHAIYRLLHSPFCMLPLTLITCTYALAANTDMIIANGTERVLENLTLENGSNGTFILQARRGASITANGIALNSASRQGGGAWIDNSQLTAQDLQINVSGSAGTGLYLVNSAVATIHDLNLSGSGTAQGVVLDGSWSGTQERAAATMTDSTITTHSGDALRVMTGDLALNNVSASTIGSSSYAVNANNNASVIIDGGSYTTEGIYSDAIWIASQNSSVTVNNATLATAGDRAIGFNAQRGSGTVTQSMISTEGINAYGLYTEASLLGDGLTINTSGSGGIGAFAALGGEATLSNSDIQTQGASASGLIAWFSSTLNADSVTVNTSGSDAVGLWARLSTFSISNSQISTSGERASGLYVNEYSSSASVINDVTLNNVTLTSAQAQAIEVNTTRLNLQVQDSRLTGGNGQLMTVTGYEDESDTANNLYSDVSLTAENSTLNGDIVVSDALNNVAVSLSSDSILNGAVINATSLSLDNSIWNLSNDSSVRQLTNNGTINFSGQNVTDALTVSGDYAGDGGLLIMNSVLGDDDSQHNKLAVGGNVLSGTTRIAINNLGGRGAQTVEGIEVVSVGGTSSGSFVKSGRIVAGAYDYDVVKKGESWYLTSQISDSDADPLVRPEGGSYTANLAASNTLFMMSLHDRLGETQFIDVLTHQPQVTSLWLRQVGGHNAWRDNSGQLKSKSNRYMAQMGGDVARWSSNGTDRWHAGLMAGYAQDKNATESRVGGYHSKGQVNGYSVGSYATWYADNVNRTGAWLDSWLQYSWFKNDVNGKDGATENYKSRGFTASLESGYTWKTGDFIGSQGTPSQWFIQPQVQAVWMRVGASEHRESNGTLIKGGGDGNLMTRLGVKTWINSHHAIDKGKQREFQPYIALNWLHNTRSFATQMDDVRVSQKGASNLGEVKIGLEGQINPYLNIWGSAGVQIGDKGYNTTTALVGMKYNF